MLTLKETKKRKERKTREKHRSKTNESKFFFGSSVFNYLFQCGEQTEQDITSHFFVCLSLSRPVRCFSRHRKSRMHVGSTMSNLVTGCLRVTRCRMNSEEKSFYSFSHFVFASMASRTDKIFIRSCSCDVVFHEEEKTDETSSEQLINIDANRSTYQFGQLTRMLPSRTFTRHSSS